MHKTREDTTWTIKDEKQKWKQTNKFEFCVFHSRLAAFLIHSHVPHSLCSRCWWCFFVLVMIYRIHLIRWLISMWFGGASDNRDLNADDIYSSSNFNLSHAARNTHQLTRVHHHWRVEQQMTISKVLHYVKQTIGMFEVHWSRMFAHSIAHLLMERANEPMKEKLFSTIKSLIGVVIGN